MTAAHQHTISAQANLARAAWQVKRSGRSQNPQLMRGEDMTAAHQHTISAQANLARAAWQVKRSGRSQNPQLMRGGKI